jgi:hypothetical protein
VRKWGSVERSEAMREYKWGSDPSLPAINPNDIIFPVVTFSIVDWKEKLLDPISGQCGNDL